MQHPTTRGSSGEISGCIKIDGEPAESVSVELARAWGRDPDCLNDPIATTRTDREGRYRFSDVPRGCYWIRPLAPGYINVDGAWAFRGRRTSVAAGSHVANCDVELILGGIISGRITDPDGRPVTGQSIELTCVGEDGIDTSPDFEDDDVETDSTGAYRILGIPPGDYFVSIGEDMPGTNDTRFRAPVVPRYEGLWQVGGDHYYKRTFYPGVTNPVGAKSIHVAAGREVKDLNFKVGEAFRAYSVSGRVIDAESGQPITQCRIQLGHKTAGGYSSFIPGSDSESDTDRNGTFRLTGLLSGRFFISARLNDDSDLYGGVVEFEIKNENITGIEIKAYHGATISGSVSIADNAFAGAGVELAGLKLSASWNRGANGYCTKTGVVQRDGSFKINGVCPGRIGIQVPRQTGLQRYFSLVGVEYSRVGADANQREFVPVKYPWEAARARPAIRPVIPLVIQPVAQPSTPSPGSPSIELVAIPGLAPDRIEPDGDQPIERCRFAGPFAPITIEDQALEGVRVALDYNNGVIEGHVDFVPGKIAEGTPLIAHISRPIAGRLWSASHDIEAGADFVVQGLEPGEHQIYVSDQSQRLTETKVFDLKKNQELIVLFKLDLI